MLQSYEKITKRTKYFYVFAVLTRVFYNIIPGEHIFMGHKHIRDALCLRQFGLALHGLATTWKHMLGNTKRGEGLPHCAIAFPTFEVSAQAL